MANTPGYHAAEEIFTNDFESYAAVNEIDAAKGDALPKALQVESLGISGNPDPDHLHAGKHHGVMHVGGNSAKNPPDRFDFGLIVKDLRELREDDVRKVALAVLKKQFSKVTLADGTNLADKYDFSGELPKTSAQKRTEIKDSIIAALATAPDAVPPEVQALLTKAKILEADRDCFGGGGAGVSQGHVEINFGISNKDEGEKNNPTLVQENILARKEAILAAIREAVKTAHAGNISDEELQKLDLQVDMRGSESYGGGVSVRIGSKIDAVDPKLAETGEKPVGPTALAGLSKEHLHRIVTDSILFKGEGADAVAPMLASESDITHLLNLYAPKLPEFAAIAKNELLANYTTSEEWEKAQEERKKIEKIRPQVSIDTSLDKHMKPNSAVHVLAELPECIDHSEVVSKIANAPAIAPVQTQTTNEVTAPAETKTVAENAAPTTDATMTQDAAGKAQEELKAPPVAPLAASKADQVLERKAAASTIGMNK